MRARWMLMVALATSLVLAGCNPGPPTGPAPDRDGDTVADDVDNCPDTPNPAQLDPDADTVGNPCDNCPDTSNADQLDVDVDGYGDVCEPHTTTYVMVDIEGSGQVANLRVRFAYPSNATLVCSPACGTPTGLMSVNPTFTTDGSVPGEVTVISSVPVSYDPAIGVRTAVIVPFGVVGVVHATDFVIRDSTIADSSGSVLPGMSVVLRLP